MIGNGRERGTRSHLRCSVFRRATGSGRIPVIQTPRFWTPILRGVVVGPIVGWPSRPIWWGRRRRAGRPSHVCLPPSAERRGPSWRELLASRAGALVSGDTFTEPLISERARDIVALAAPI